MLKDAKDLHLDTNKNYHVCHAYISIHSMKNNSIYLKYLSDYRQNDDSSNFQDFGAVDKALIDIGVNNVEGIAIYKILAAILHLGNVIFEENPLVDGCKIADSTANHSRYAAQLLGIEQKNLEMSLLTRKMEINGSDPIV